jgi:hypothetical protein
MAQKIVIAELDIDIQALLKTTSDLKKQIDSLKNTQKELAASGQSTSEAFVENEAVLKSLNSAYTNNIKVITESGKATAQQADQAELLTLALTKEATSITEAREQNKLLNKLRNETNTTTKEGQAQLVALNAKLDANNEYIKENADAYLKQKINIGNYSESIKEAAQSINPLNGGLSGFVERSNAAGGAGNLLKNAFMQITTGVWGMVKASLAFIATPIGAIIAAIVVVATVMYNIFKSFTPIVDKVEQIFAGLSATLSVVKNTIIAIVTGAKSLGSAFSGLTGEMDKAYNSAVALKKAQQDLEDAMQSAELASAKSRVEINKLNIQARDRTKTEAERLALLGKAETLEKGIQATRRANALENLRIAKEQIKVNLNASDQEIAGLSKNLAKTKELLEQKGTNVDEYINNYVTAQKAVYEVDNEANVNLEKNINRQNKLLEDQEAKQEKAAAAAETRRQKQAEARQKAIDDAISKQEQELRLLQEKNRFEEDELKKAQTLAVKEISILDSKLKNKKISQTEYDAERLAIDNNLIEIQKQKDADELQRVKDFDAKKKELQNQIDIANATTQAEKDAIKLSQDLEKHLLELETIKATETEKAELRKLILEQYNLDVQKLTTDAAIKQAEIQRDADVKQIESEKQRQEILIGLAQQLAQSLLGVLGNSLAGQLAAIALDAVLQIARLKIATSASQQINLAAGTAASIPTAGASLIAAKATNVALGVQSKAQQAAILKSAAISGLGAVARKFEKGGIQEIGGKRHSQGGTKFVGEDGTMFEAERGEGIGILNRKAYSAFMDFNNTFGNGKSGGGVFQGGGIITQGVRPQTLELTSLIDAVANMPAPIVTVEEIQTVGNRYVKVKQSADF